MGNNSGLWEPVCCQALATSESKFYEFAKLLTALEVVKLASDRQIAFSGYIQARAV